MMRKLTISTMMMSCAENGDNVFYSAEENSFYVECLGLYGDLEAPAKKKIGANIPQF
jgi:hypothetical protein